MSRPTWAAGPFWACVSPKGWLAIEDGSRCVVLGPDDADLLVILLGRRLGWVMSSSRSVRAGYYGLMTSPQFAWEPVQEIYVTVPAYGTGYFRVKIFGPNSIASLFRWLCQHYDWVDA